MNEQDCAIGCDCKDMIYLNDETLDLIHKFEINPTTGALTEIGNPWLDNFNNPHGLAVDINGSLYIAQQTSGTVSRIDCDGNIKELSAIANPIDGYRFRTQNYSQVDNILYVNGSAASEGIVGAIDLCDGSLIGMMASGSSTTTTAWGHYNDCLLYTSPSPRDATLSRMPSSA